MMKMKKWMLAGVVFASVTLARFANSSIPPVPRVDDPQFLNGMTQGAVRVWARFDAESNKSDLFLQYFNAEGKKDRAAKLLRKTSGEVLNIKVLGKGPQEWVVWVSKLSTEDDQTKPHYLLAAVRISKEGAMQGKPIELDNFYASSPFGDFQAVETQDGGVLVAAPSEDSSCPHKVDGEDLDGECYSFRLFRIESEGNFKPLSQRKIPGGQGGVIAALDLGGTAFASGYAYEGGPTIKNIIVAYHKETSVPKFSPAECLLPMEQYYTGKEIVTICTNDYWERKKRGPCPWPGENSPSGCHVMQLAFADGTTLPSKKDKFSTLPIVSLNTHCQEGHPVREMIYLDEAGNKQSLVLDPMRKEASLGNLFVWTGQRLLELDKKGNLVTRRCQEDGRLVR